MLLKQVLVQKLQLDKCFLRVITQRWTQLCSKVTETSPVGSRPWRCCPCGTGFIAMKYARMRGVCTKILKSQLNQAICIRCEKSGLFYYIDIAPVCLFSFMSTHLLCLKGCMFLPENKQIALRSKLIATIPRMFTSPLPVFLLCFPFPPFLRIDNQVQIARLNLSQGITVKNRLHQG